MFSVQRDAHKKNYTCVSNQVLRDERLSLEAKGFMAVVLSLPDEWEFSVRGMVSLCGVSTKAMYKVLAELQKCGYLKLIQEKSNNRFLPVQYVFREICEETEQSSSTDVLDTAFPLPDFPLPPITLSENEESEIPLSENEISSFSLSENEPQSNTNISSIENIINTFFINRSDQSDEKEELYEVDKGGLSEEGGEEIIDVEYRELKKEEKTEEKKEEVQKEAPKRYSFDKVSVQINAQRLAVVYERTMVNRIAYLITDVINGGARTINGEVVPAERIREIFMKIRGEDVSTAIKSVGKREIKNFNAYYITTLYNTVIDRLEKTKPHIDTSPDADTKSSIDIAAIMEDMMKKYRELAEKDI